MRTTLDLEDDVLALARKLAQEQGRTIGQVVSDLARRGLHPREPSPTRGGIPLLRSRRGTRKPTLELVNRLRDE